MSTATMEKPPTTIHTVESLFVQCSLRVRNFEYQILVMSDCCGMPANSAVVMEDDSQMYRCPIHRGIRTLHPTTQYGPVVDEVEIRDW